MRHAKSSWANEGMRDHERPLNDRGERIAPLMAEYLDQSGESPTRILCSSAVRALQTAERIASRLNISIAVEDELYLAAPKTWLQLLHQYSGEERLLAIGHNPGIEEFVAHVSGEYSRMPTAAIAKFSVTETEELSYSAFQLQAIWRPKEVL